MAVSPKERVSKRKSKASAKASTKKTNASKKTAKRAKPKTTTVSSVGLKKEYLKSNSLF